MLTLPVCASVSASGCQGADGLYCPPVLTSAGPEDSAGRTALRPGTKGVHRALWGDRGQFLHTDNCQEWPELAHVSHGQPRNLRDALANTMFKQRCTRVLGHI